MRELIEKIEFELHKQSFNLSRKPILIGGGAMQYYGLRKIGSDIDLVICDEDYQELSSTYPEKRKDIYGDLGVVVWPFEIWRSIALLDYNFYLDGAIECDAFFVVGIDRLLFMRVSAMDNPKYQNDLKLIEEYYYQQYRNQQYLIAAEAHIISYRKNDGVIFSGKYQD